MTRINAGFPPKKLNDKMLIAEHREIKRIPNAIKSGRYNLDGIPDQFTLGKGHVKFFYNKLEYLHRRYEKIYDECKRRGFNVTYFGEAFRNLPKELWNNWYPQTRDAKLIEARIELRLKESYSKAQSGSK